MRPQGPGRGGRLDGASRPAGGLAGDLGLLRGYEPVVCFTKGELFFPTAVRPYVARCSLWLGDREGAATCIVPAGKLTIEGLCEEAVRRRDRPLSMRFVGRSLSRGEYRRWRRVPRERLMGELRFTTTGMFGRIADAGFRISLLLRGTVASGLAAAAEIAYREQLESERFTYYGRVVRTGGYICLQYWFFYAMNDWRSTFGGVNDHEGDWELVTVYLAEQEAAAPRPAWVAFSAHDHHGDDLRRRWDDPELRRHGDHPVLFPGAGSHSGAFVPGDYVISVDPPRLRRPIALARRAQRLLAPWRDDTGLVSGFGIPFVDYARGDGKTIGPGQSTQWQAELIDDQTRWVLEYRGLWGLDTEDRFGGERAPSGPRYERDGSVRSAWANPLGWAGLLKVAPSDAQVTALLSDRIAMLKQRVFERDETIAARLADLRGVRVELRSLAAHDYARAQVNDRRSEMTDLERELDQLIEDRSRLAEELRAHLDTLRSPPTGEDPQAHVEKSFAPYDSEQQSRTRFLGFWAAISTPLLLALVPVILLARPLTWIATLAAAGVLFVGVEAFARRRFLSSAASFLLLIAIAAIVVLLVELLRQHWTIALSAVFGVASLALLVGNLGDLRHGWRRGGSIGEDPQRDPSTDGP
jgi:hypothetical protein